MLAKVKKNIEKRDLPDALTTLAERQGDCNAGVTRQRDAFYYHAWNEVCLGNRWVSIDTTTNQFPADLTHLRFIVGEMQEQVRIGALLGTLTIEPLGSPTAH